MNLITLPHMLKKDLRKAIVETEAIIRIWVLD